MGARGTLINPHAHTEKARLCCSASPTSPPPHSQLTSRVTLHFAPTSRSTSPPPHSPPYPPPHPDLTFHLTLHLTPSLPPLHLNNVVLSAPGPRPPSAATSHGFPEGNVGEAAKHVSQMFTRSDLTQQGVSIHQLFKTVFLIVLHPDQLHPASPTSTCPFTGLTCSNYRRWRSRLRRGGGEGG